VLTSRTEVEPVKEPPDSGLHPRSTDEQAAFMHESELPVDQPGCSHALSGLQACALPLEYRLRRIEWTA